MSDSNPLFLLDFDGVINAVSKRTSDIYPEETWRRTRLLSGNKRYPILFSDVVLDSLRRAGEVAEVKYLSTWRADTAKFAAEFNLPEWGYLDESILDAPEEKDQATKYQYRMWEPYWKVSVARKAMTGNTRPVLWVDDDIPFMRGAEKLIAERREVAELVTIHPDSSQGLSPRELDRIEEFIRAYG